MKYEELKDFIRNKMRMANGKNYQPVMIKTLNQNEGKSTEDELKLALQKANPEYELSHFNDCPVFYVLTKSNPVARYEEENKIYHLLDYESYNDQEKAWITMDCDSKINEQSEPKYFVLEDEKELENAQKIFLDNLKKHTTKQDKIIIGFPGPEENIDGDANFISNVDLWWHSHNLPDEKIPRFWNCFGIGEPTWGKSNDIVLQINPPMNEINRQAPGAFVKDSEGSIFICHSGRLGGNAPAGFDEAYPHEEKWIEADDGKKDLRWLILVSNITDNELPKNIADYAKTVEQFKSGQLASQKVPYYLLFRYNSEGSQYRDELDKGIYHYPKGANYTKVVEHAKTIWFDKIDGEYCFWGYGTISKVNSRPDEDLEAISDDFTLFEKESDSIMRQEKFLKKATPKIEEMIVNRPGFNNQHSISEIDKEIFEEIVGSSQIDESDPMVIAHKLFLIEMEQKKHKTPFTDFNHVDFVGYEIEDKLVALANSSKILSIDKWDELKSTPEKICSIVRDACASGPKGSQNLIWSPQYDDSENEYFDQLDDAAKKEFGKNLYDFFKGTDPIEKRFNNFISFLPKIKRRPEIRLLAYLMFLLDSTTYFPVHPSNFKKLLEFYGFEKIKEVSWKKYSKYLELAAKLKPFLSKLFPNEELTSLQIQSYMWVIAGAVSKKYWLIRPGTDGEDWEKQRNAGLVGIHYYTLDLSKYASPNNQLTKRKLNDKMQEIRKANGLEPGPQPALDANFGQFERIFAIRKKDKIVTISNNSTLLGIGNATDRYKFRTDVSINCHTVPVDWYDVESRTIPMQQINRSIKNLSIKDYVDIMSSQGNPPDNPQQVGDYGFYHTVLDFNPNLILYGPPGTGKTHHGKELANELTKNQNKLAICWPTDKNENKIEDFARVIKEKGKVLWGVNWKLAQVKSSHFPLTGYIYYKGNIIGISKISDFTSHDDTSDEDLKLRAKKWHDGTVSTYYIHMENIERCDPFSHKKLELMDPTKEMPDRVQQQVYVNDLNPEFTKSVTFHPSYSYEDFVEGFRPNVKDSDNQPYVLEDGIFKLICNKAKNDPDNVYVLFIDEINRGNIPKILGELITLIEKDKRLPEFSLKLTYSKDDFFVPENLRIIATMNTADKSLMQMDEALRRRFVFEELMPEPDLLEKKNRPGKKYKDILVNINKKIIEGDRIKQFRDRQIGHSYFWDSPFDDKKMRLVIKYQIIPLLQDYFYDDYDEIRRVLGDKIIGAGNRPSNLLDEGKESSLIQELRDHFSGKNKKKDPSADPNDNPKDEDQN